MTTPRHDRDRDALATDRDRWRVTDERGRVSLEIEADDGGHVVVTLTGDEALRAGHALVQAARRVGAR
jgi:hypothetical protein